MLSICAFGVQAQDTKNEIETLALKVDSLEHELSYLQLSYELNSLNADIRILSNELSIKASEIMFDIYTMNIDSRWGDNYRKLFNAYEDRVKSTQRLIEVKESLLFVRAMASTYTEDEMSVLLNTCDAINKGYKVLEISMERLKALIEEYQKRI